MGKINKQENSNSETHVGVKFLVEELRKIYLKTHGFELIDRVKLIQKRNDQLMQELQPYYPEPIISEEIKLQTKTTSKNGETPPFRKYKHKYYDKEYYHNFKRIIVFCLKNTNCTFFCFMELFKSIIDSKNYTSMS